MNESALRVVIADRSQALNERTRQANVLASTLASSRGALQETKVSVGACRIPSCLATSDRSRPLADSSAAAVLARSASSPNTV